MTAVRKPKPRAVPTTLAELVLDLEERADAGDGAFEVPAAEWAQLVERAQEEETAQPRELPPPSAAVALLQAEAGLGERDRVDLCKALGVGIDTGWTEALEVTRGYVMALDAERDAGVRRVDALSDADERRYLDFRKALGAGEHASWDDLVKLAQDTSAALAQLSTKGSVERPAHRKEAKSEEPDPRASCPKAKAEEPEVEHPECPHCGEADGHKPEECAAREDDRPTMVESMVKAAARARPKKRRATKKFPLGGDPLELCTVCGAPFGEHDGQRCPKKQRRMKYVDEPTTAEAPF